MRALTLQQPNVAQGEQQLATCGRSLSSNYVPLSLENKFLVQTSTLMPQPRSPLLDFAANPSSCPSLQPSSLSSTSSSLLSSSSLSPSLTSPLLTSPLLTSPLLTSPLLSTENKLLASISSLSSAPNASLLSTSLTSSALLNRFAHAPSFVHHALDEEQKRDDGEDEDREETSEVMQSSFEDISLVHEMFYFNLLNPPFLLTFLFKMFDKHHI